MLTLQLLRHAKSGWDVPGLSDLDRPLAERGIRDAQAVAEHLRQSASCDLVICSPALRTRQTLDLIAGGLGLGVSVRIDESLYGATAAGLWRTVRQLPGDVDSVLLIGHNPALHELANSLGDDTIVSQAASRLQHKLPTGSLVTFTWNSASWSSARRTDATLSSFVRPRDVKPVG